MERLAGRVILLWGWRRCLAAMLAGAITSLALAPFDFPAAGFVAFPFLVWLLDGAVSAKGALSRFLPFFTTGWCFGFGYFLAGSGWVAVPIATAEHWIALPFVAIGSAAALALFYGLAAVLARPFWGEGLGRIAALAFAFGVVEWLRLTFLSGLAPMLAWNAIGATIMPRPIFMQAVQVIGMAGMSTAAVFIFSAPALLGTRRHMVAGLSLAAILIGLQVGYGSYRLVTAPVPEDFLQARLVQPADFAAGPFEQSLKAYLELSSGGGVTGSPSLILWPERSVPFVLMERGDILSELERTTDEGQVLVLGTMRRAGTGAQTESELRNAVVVVNAYGEITDAADKKPLPRLAAYQPLRWAADALGLQSAFAAYAPSGEGSRHILRIGDEVNAIPLIGAEVLRSGTTDRKMREVELILNPAGDTAFAGLQAPYQHLRQAQVHAVEAGLPLLVAMQQGISAAIDSQGHVLDALGPGIYGALDVSLPLAERKIVTPGYNLPGGLIFAAFFGILALLSSTRERLI